MSQSSNVTFPEAFCIEINKIIGIHKAREIYWDESNTFFNQSLEFRCPDANCQQLFTAVGVEPKLPIKGAIHFRIRRNKSHSEKCRFSNQILSLDQPSQSDNDNIHNRLHVIPSKFLTNKLTKKLTESTSTIINQNLNNHSDKKIQKYGSGNIENLKKHYTKQLQVLVDCFNSYKPEYFIKNNYKLELPNAINKKRYFHECFREIELFQSDIDSVGNHEAYVYYGQIKSVIRYPTGFALHYDYEPKIELNGKTENLNLSIFLKHSAIEEYYKKTELLNILDALANEKDWNAIAYIIKAYPILTKTKYGKDVYSIVLTDLSDLYILFEKQL